MRTDKEIAFKLRKQGKSYKQIHTQLGMSVSTLSNWFKNVDFSEEIKRSVTAEAQKLNTARLQSLNKARGDLLHAYYQQAIIEARQELEKYKTDPLFVAGVMLYWGEGDKLHKNHTRFTNTDPEMLKLYVKFLFRFGNFTFEDMRLAIFLYKDLDTETCLNYWVKETGISKVHKPMILPGRDKRRKLAYGTCSIIIMNTYFKKKLMFWIDHLPKMVLNTVPSGEIKQMRP
jgi:transcriptional regulator with XRE-family HTH domain